MNKLQQWHERRFQAMTKGDPSYCYGYICIDRVADPAECPTYVNITGTPFRVAFVLRRGLDEFEDGAIYYCYGYQCGPYQQRTPGKYLRKLKDGLADPTMTHMEDPYAVRVGDYLLDNYKCSRVVAIKDEASTDTRFAYVREYGTAPDGATIWDVRQQPRHIWTGIDPTTTPLLLT